MFLRVTFFWRDFNSLATCGFGVFFFWFFLHHPNEQSADTASSCAVGIINKRTYLKCMPTFKPGDKSHPSVFTVTPQSIISLSLSHTHELKLYLGTVFQKNLRYFFSYSQRRSGHNRIFTVQSHFRGFGRRAELFGFRPHANKWEDVNQRKGGGLWSVAALQDDAGSNVCVATWQEAFTVSGLHNVNTSVVRWLRFCVFPKETHMCVLFSAYVLTGVNAAADMSRLKSLTNHSASSTPTCPPIFFFSFFKFFCKWIRAN